MSPCDHAALRARPVSSYFPHLTRVHVRIVVRAQENCCLRCQRWGVSRDIGKGLQQEGHHVSHVRQLSLLLSCQLLLLLLRLPWLLHTKS